MRESRRWMVLVACMLVGALVSGCGGFDDDDRSGPGAEPGAGEWGT